LFVGLFYLRDAKKSFLKQIQISNSKFNDIESKKNDLNTLSQGGVAYFSIRSSSSIEKVTLIENCTFENCTGAVSGGVFYLDLNTVHINLENVKFLYNSAFPVINGTDIYCASSTGMKKEVVNQQNTCSTSKYSILRGAGNERNPEIIPRCSIVDDCEGDIPGTCKDNCFKFKKKFFLIYFYTDI
jgi:hypothetical protein